MRGGIFGSMNWMSMGLEVWAWNYNGLSIQRMNWMSMGLEVLIRRSWIWLSERINRINMGLEGFIDCFKK